MMHIYTDYLDFLERHKLLADTLARQIMPWTGQLICHLFDTHSFPRVLEIGRSAGHSFGLFRWLSPESYVVSVDPKPKPTAKEVAALFDKNYLFIDQASPAAFDDVVGSFDFVLIDGDHKKKRAALDWKHVQELIAPGGVVMFDNLGHSGKCGQVFDAVKIEGRVARRAYPCDPRVWPDVKHGNPYRGTCGLLFFT